MSHPLIRPMTLLLRAASDPGLERPQAMAAPLATLIHHLRSLALLAARLHVAQVFFLSGLTKIRDWSTTRLLFEEEYRVPLLSPELAAWLGTGGELLLPVLLALGLGGRFAALGLGVVNIVAVLSLAEIAPAALLGHQLWGVLLLGVLLWGAGRWSLDALIAR
jgi:putative oxidoreductase